MVLLKQIYIDVSALGSVRDLAYAIRHFVGESRACLEQVSTKDAFK
jgi:hypothetical protein